MLKSAKAGKTVNMDDMPPLVSIKEITTPTSNPPTQDKARPPPPANKPLPPAAKPPPKKPASNLIDLDDPEFDEFNLTDEDFASMAAAMDRQHPQAHSSSNVAATQSHSSASVSQSGSGFATTSQSGSNPAVSHSGSKTSPPQPKPRSPPKPHPPSADKPQPKPRPKPNPFPMGPGGLIDLDDPAFDEFTLTEEDMAAMASVMVDDRQAKKPKIEGPSPVAHQSPLPYVRPAPPRPQPAAAQVTSQQPQAAMSLPVTLKKPMSSGSDQSVIVSFLNERKEQYQRAAMAQKKDPTRNKEYKVIAAKFARVVKAVESEQEIDLSQMPGPPPGYKSSYNIDLRKLAPPPPAPKPVTSPSQSQSSVAEEEEPDAPPNPDIPVPKTALEALEQRLAKYKEGSKMAQEKGETSRVRRMGRIIKQYDAAIKATKAGKLYDYSELPCPPGYPPIPASRQVRAAIATVPLPTQSLPVRTSPSASHQSLSPSISRQQLAFVERRMSELKRAAKIEQTKNNKEGALEYMKRARGLETMLKAAQSGLPVNLEQVPPSPFAELDQTKPSSQVTSHLRPAEEKDVATFELIIKQLEKQIEICNTNAETYKKMSSNASAIEYENMSQNCQRELLALKGIQGGGYGPPKFSLETRTLTIIHSNAHLNGSVCEVEVIQVMNITRPPKYEEKDMDVYVEVEFPYPIDSPPKKSTDVVHKTCNPEFKEQSLLFDIDRKHQRSMSRAFKRSPLKCTVWQHRSLRKHIFIGEDLW